MGCEVSWFSALCDDDYEFLGVPDPGLRSSFAHCRNIVQAAETGGLDGILLPSGYALGIDASLFEAAIAAVVAKINAHATHQVSFPATNAGGAANGTVSYKCMNAAGATAAYGSGCAAGYSKQSFVSYQLNCSVHITVPLPLGLANPFALTAAGTTQIQ